MTDIIRAEVDHKDAMVRGLKMTVLAFVAAGLADKALVYIPYIGPYVGEYAGVVGAVLTGLIYAAKHYYKYNYASETIKKVI